MEKFDDLSDVYEAMVDWPKRLANEEPFYRRWFAQVQARRVLDAACGTGNHAARFHQWGLEVEAADISPAMIARARAAWGEPSGLRWQVRGFDEPAATAAPFDAALCVGNSLALAADRETASRAVAAMLVAVRPGGIVVLQVLNLWRLPDGPCVWQKAVRSTLALGEVLIVKGVHRARRAGYVDIVVTPLAGAPAMRSESVRFWGLEPGDIEDMARRGGAARVDFFGGYREEPYDREQSVDLVAVITK
jgi:glycine/sarcosine N-methyltransferase